MRWSFIFIWPALCVCIAGKSSWQRTPHSNFIPSRLLLVHPAPPSQPTALLWGRNNCVMVCSLSGSSQATEVFSQSRHLLRCAALFSGDVMFCGKSRPYIKCKVEDWSGGFVYRRGFWGWGSEILEVGIEWQAFCFNGQGNVFDYTKHVAAFLALFDSKLNS